MNKIKIKELIIKIRTYLTDLSNNKLIFFLIEHFAMYILYKKHLMSKIILYLNLNLRKNKRAAKDSLPFYVI